MNNYGLHLVFKNQCPLKILTYQILEDSHLRTEAQNKYNKYKDLISTLLKQSKQSYFFEKILKT